LTSRPLVPPSGALLLRATCWKLGPCVATAPATVWPVGEVAVLPVGEVPWLAFTLPLVF
jgi:hypothetical protein